MMDDTSRPGPYNVPDGTDCLSRQRHMVRRPKGIAKPLKKEPISLNHHMEKSYLPIRSTVI